MFLKVGRPWAPLSGFKTRVFLLGGPPGSHLGAPRVPSGTPRGPLGTLPGAPEACQYPPGTSWSAQGPHQIHKVNMLKTRERSTLTPLDLSKIGLGRFFDLPRLPPRPPRASIPLVRVAPGAQKASQELSGSPREAPGDPTGAPGVGCSRFRSSMFF